MSLFRYGASGISLKALLENPELQNPPSFNSGNDLKKSGSNALSIPNHGSAFLGPNLWERPGDDDDAFDFEYMDLDEFLSENGIPVDLDVDQEKPTSLLEEALKSSPQKHLNPGGSSLSLKIDPPSPPLRTPHSPASQNRPKQAFSPGLYFPGSPPAQSPNSPMGLDLGPVSPVSSSKTIEDCFLKGLLESSPDAQEKKSDSHQRKSELVKFEVPPEDLSLVTVPVLAGPCSPARSRQSVSYPTDLETSEDFDKAEISLVEVPGQENFDPKERRFTDEELKPQPMIKKSKKVFVPEDNKDEKYWNRRKKNNVAAKRSRDARRVKENQIAMRAAFLERENDAIKLELEVIKAENEKLKKRLAKYEGGL